MKKWTRILLAFLLSFLLAGCGTAPSSGSSQEEEVHDTLELSDGEEVVSPDGSEDARRADKGSEEENEDSDESRAAGEVRLEDEGTLTSASGTSDDEASLGEPSSDESLSDEASSGEEDEPHPDIDNPPPGSEEDAEKNGLPEDGSYTTKEDVALYIYTYGHLPDNFITKKEAEALGWEGGSLEPYAPGKCIGGNRFGNYEGLLPEKEGRVYTECDIDTLGAAKRGAKRIVFSNDGLIYYTEDHYESFELLYGEE